MESDDVLERYQQSIQMHNGWYNPFIGNGDTSAYAMVDNSRPYGAAVFKQKEEWVKHETM